MASGLVLVGLWVADRPVIQDPATAATVSRKFIVYDATLYKNKPSLVAYSVHPITLLYESRFFTADQLVTAMPAEQTVRSLASTLRNETEPVVIDIERWPLKGDAATVQATVAKFLLVLSWMKSEAPNMQVGAYGTVPLPDYWRAIRDPASEEYKAWQQDNDRLDKIATHVDALFPSIYTFYTDQKGWVTYAVAQIAEARRKANGKPVYAFLWPQYHESNLLLSQQPLDPDYWELELNTVYQHADGVVIWGGWGANGPEPWKEEALWWQVTKRFLTRIDSVAPARPRDLNVQ
jgi:hypothetical protein